MMVYKIINKINNKIYIGQTIQSLSQRWAAHNSRFSFCRLLKRSINKYGKENFEIKIISRCNSIDEMNHREQYYIILFNSMAPNGYNLKTGGNNSLASKETREKMSKSQKGILKPRTKEHTEKIAKQLRGRKQSKELIQKRVLNRKNTKHSERTKEKIRLSKIGIKRSQETKEKIGKKLRTLNLISPNKIWDKNNLQKEALKYKTRTEFNKNSKGAYLAAWRLEILEEICSHMPNRVLLIGNNNPTFKWTIEKLQEEASKYKTINDFRNNSNSAYVTSKRLGIFEKITKHMLRHTLHKK